MKIGETMKTNVLALVVTLTLSVILVGSLMVPVIDEATTANFTVEESNTLGAYRVDTANVPITFATATEGYTLNGELIEADYSVTNQMLIISDKFIVATSALNASRTIYVTYSGASFATTSSITCENGHLKFNDLDVDVGYSWIAYPSNTGSYMFAGNLANVNVDKDKDVYIAYMGPTYNSGTSLSSMITGRGTVGALVPNCYTGSTYTATPGNVSLNYEPGTPINLNTSYSMSVKLDETEYSATAANVFVPISYHVIKEDSNNVVSLLTVIPVIVILSLVIAAVAAIRNRD